MSFDSCVRGENEEENIAFMWCIRAINVSMKQMLAVGKCECKQTFPLGFNLASQQGKRNWKLQMVFLNKSGSQADKGVGQVDTLLPRQN